MIHTSGTISEILKLKGAQVWATTPGATVFEAMQLMADRNVGALLVLDREKLCGIVSERDCMRRVELKGRSSKETLVREILSGSVIHVSPGHSVEECMRLMTDQHIRHLPVLEGERVVGLVSIGDLVNWIISAQSTTIQQLRTYITGGYPA
jgi:CBS domain-containing protein